MGAHMILSPRRHLFIANAASVTLAVAALAAALLAFRDPDQLLVVHFEAGRGIDYFGSRLDVFAIAGTGAGIALVNAALASGLLRHLPFAGFLVAYGNVLFALLLLLGVAGIVAVN